jgi:hypothetical protein
MTFYPPPDNPGYPPPPPYYPYPVTQASNGLAVAALVCGLVGLVIFWIVLAPLAIIFGSIGRSRAKQGASGKGMATAGLVLGIVGIVGYLVLMSVLVDSGRAFFV